MMVAPKSPGVAVLASFFIPGLGSMISGRGGMGALILCLYVVSWILTIVLIGFIGVIGFWIWGMIQGYADAVAWNRRHGIIS
jgi:TM2 domain-containing membrane protein YozV